MASASCGRSVLNSCTKASKRPCCCRLFMPGGACGFLLQGQVHAFVAAVLLRPAGLYAFDRDAEAQPPDRELGEGEQGVGTRERPAISGTNGEGQAARSNELLLLLGVRLIPPVRAFPDEPLYGRGRERAQ